MSDGMSTYKRTVGDLFTTILDKEEDSIDRAAQLMADTVVADNLIHVIGTGGHSNMGAYEMFSRAGGLVPINAILDPGTLVCHGASRSSVIERTPGYGVAVMKAYDISDGALIIVNAYGMNAMTIDVALEAKRRGVPTIGVTSREFSEQVPPDHPARHPSKRNLCDSVDMHVDCHMPYGDAVVSLEGMEAKIAPVSTLVNSFALNLLVIRTCEHLLARGIIPPVWISSNVAGADEKNKSLLARYPAERFDFS